MSLLVFYFATILAQTSDRSPVPVLLCFIRTDVVGYRGFPQGSPHPSFAQPRRELRRAPLRVFLTDHCRVPGTTIRGSQWGPASDLELCNYGGLIDPTFRGAGGVD